ncbi:hypothetical protein [Enterovirga sp. CN4-39]|uniref:hypothetical protein n=1 Tax=Enterovirga sp. CN4-39 TaxID=3400910 RepID=UPI003C012CCC
MPRLPSAEQLGRRDPRAAYSAPNYPTDSPVAQANAALGRAAQGLGHVFGTAAVERDNEAITRADVLNVAEQQSGWTTDKLELDRRFTVGAEGADTDYGTWSTRHAAELEQRRQARAAAIADPNKRALFLAHTADDAAASAQRVVARASEVVRTENRTRFVQSYDQDISNETAPNATDGDRERIRAERLAKVDSAAKTGLLTPAEALELKRSGDSRSAKLILDQLPPQERVQLFGSPAERPSLKGLKLKSGEAVAGGDIHPATVGLAHSIQQAVPDLRYFSAFNDDYHKGTSSRHAKGLGMDFTVQDAANSGQAAQTAKGLLLKAGLSENDFEVIDEYKSPSARSTGGHIHVAFRTPEAAAKFSGIGGAPQSATASLVDRIVGVESAGDPNAKNPNSSATGAGQFIASTWIGMVRKYRPEIAGTMGRDDILALRNDPALSREMVARYAEENAATLKAAGIEPTPGRIYLAHFLGPEGAKAVLSAGADTPISDLVGADAVSANRSILAGKTAAQVQAWADQKMGASGGGAVSPYSRYVERLSPEERNALYKTSVTGAVQVALQRAEQYENAVLNFSAGRGALPSREAIEADPQLDLARRNAVLRLYDAATGGRAAQQQGTLVEMYERNFIDAQEGAGELVERSAIENDPRLDLKQKNDLLRKRDQVRRVADTGALQASEKQRKEAAENREQTYNRMLIEAERGAAQLPARTVIENDATLDEKQRNVLLTKFDKASESVGQLGAAVSRLQAGQLDGMGFSKDAQKDVDRIITANMPIPAVLFAEDEEGARSRSRVTEIARRVGYVPDVATDMIRGGLTSADPARTEMALSFASQIMSANPNAFATSQGANEIQQAVSQFEFHVNTRGQSLRDAATIIAMQNDPQWRAKNKRSEEDLRSFEKGIRDDDAGLKELRRHLSSFSVGPVTIGRPQAGFTAGAENELLTDYLISARYHYERTGDAEAAKKIARNELLGDPAKGNRGVYGATWFNGSRTLMKFAPDAAPGYPAMPDTGHEYVADQAVAHIKATTGLDIKKSDIIIDMATRPRDTAEAFKQGVRVPYRLLYRDKDGLIQEARPNVREGWAADPVKARAEFDERSSMMAVESRARAAGPAVPGPEAITTPSNPGRAPTAALEAERREQEALRQRVEDQKAFYARQRAADLENERKRREALDAPSAPRKGQPGRGAIQ